MATRLGGIFDFDNKSERLVEVLRELENPKIWDNPEQAQALGKERGQLEVVVNTIRDLEQGMADAEAAEYKDFCLKLRDGAKQIINAVKQKDFDQASKASATIGKACTECHENYRS